MIPHTDLLITNTKDLFFYFFIHSITVVKRYYTRLIIVKYLKIKKKSLLHTSVIIAANGYINPNPNWKIGRKG